jgi:hypothetical protein
MIIALWHASWLPPTASSTEEEEEEKQLLLLLIVLILYMQVLNAIWTAPTALCCTYTCQHRLTYSKASSQTEVRGCTRACFTMQSHQTTLCD